MLPAQFPTLRKARIYKLLTLLVLTFEFKAMTSTDTKLPQTQLKEPIQLRHMMGDVYVTIEQKEDCIVARWSGHITADDVVTAAQVYLELLESCGCSKLLTDKRDSTGYWENANDWLRFLWMPKAITAGLRYMANVYSCNIFSTLPVRELQEQVWPELCMRNFYVCHEAEEWLSRAGEAGPAEMQAATA